MTEILYHFPWIKAHCVLVALWVPPELNYLTSETVLKNYIIHAVAQHKPNREQISLAPHSDAGQISSNLLLTIRCKHLIIIYIVLNFIQGLVK